MEEVAEIRQVVKMRRIRLRGYSSIAEKGARAVWVERVMPLVSVESYWNGGLWTVVSSWDSRVHIHPRTL